jgi:hypothetical protein
MTRGYDTETDRLHFLDWTPGLDNDHLTLGEVLDTLPASPPESIPFIIQLLENPKYWWLPIPGRITLMRHDAIHVLLGRGLSRQDEAFVIGFTMGASWKDHSSRLRTIQYRFFRWCVSRLYRPPHRFNENDLRVFDMAFAKGEESGAENLESFPFERFLDLTIRELRVRLGINTQKLYAVYRKEKIMVPNSRYSRRLDTDWQGFDPQSIYRPPGEIAYKDGDIE